MADVHFYRQFLFKQKQTISAEKFAQACSGIIDAYGLNCYVKKREYIAGIEVSFTCDSQYVHLFEDEVLIELYASIPSMDGWNNIAR